MDSIDLYAGRTHLKLGSIRICKTYIRVKSKRRTTQHTKNIHVDNARSGNRGYAFN